MKIEKKIEQWLKDDAFSDYCTARMNEEVKNSLMNGGYDPLFEELDEGFDDDDEFIVPLVEYLSYKLHLAKLYKNKVKRERGIWWVFTQICYEWVYVSAFSEQFGPLMDEVRITIFKMLRREYKKLQDSNE